MPQPTRWEPYKNPAKQEFFDKFLVKYTLDFYEICVRFGEISLNLVRSQPDLVKISLDLARSHQIQWDLHWIWQIFAWNQLFWLDFSLWMVSTESTIFRHKSNRSDLTPLPVDNDSELPPPDFVGSVSG